MIDPALSAAVSRVADRANDILHGYGAGFEPNAPDVARRSAPRLPDMNALATSAPDDAYFIVSLNGRLRFTRDGAFRFADGVLRGQDGSAVLGLPAGQTRELAPLRVDPVDVALRRIRDPRIDENGLVTVGQTSTDARTGVRREERVALGRIALARFPAGTKPVRESDRLVSAPPGASPKVGVPGADDFGTLQTHVRELGRVDLEAGLWKLQEAYLSLEALQSAYRAHDGLDKSAMDLLK